MKAQMTRGSKLKDKLETRVDELMGAETEEAENAIALSEQLKTDYGDTGDHALKIKDELNQQKDLFKDVQAETEKIRTNDVDARVVHAETEYSSTLDALLANGKG